MKFIQLMSNNISEAEQKLMKLAYNSARKRVAEALLFIYERYREKNVDEPVFPVNRENISALAGISPESVSRNLTDLREEGLIETFNGSIKILQHNKLKNLKN